MYLSRTEELKTKLAGGAAAIAIEAAFIALIVYGLTASHVASKPRSIKLVPIQDSIIKSPKPPELKPIEKLIPDFPPPKIDIDRYPPPDPQPLDQLTQVKPQDLPDDPVIVVIDPPPLPPEPKAKAAPVRIAAGFDGRHKDVLQPDYPSAARRLDLEGRVELRVLIGTDGRVKQAEVRTSSGHRVLDEAAVAHALKKWRFKPATEDGVPVESWTMVPVTFELKQA